MILGDHLYHWVATQNRNLPLIALITFGFPRMFIRAILSGNRGKNLWGGREACVTLSFDCDYPEDVVALPGIVRTLERYRLKASFAAVGHWVEKYPAEHLAVLEYGHELMNHTYSHPDNELLNPGRKFREISRGEKFEEIERCHEICRRVLGYEPSGLRVPHFKNLFTPEIYELLKDVGYSYSSSTWLTNTTTRGLPFTASHGIVEFPLTTCPLHPFTVFDTWHSLNAQRLSHRLLHRGPASYARLFHELIELAKETGSYLNIYMDPLDIKKIPQFEEILEALGDSAIVTTTYEDYLKNGWHVE